MGQFRVSTRLVELLVDTGATLLVVPSVLALELGLVAFRTQEVVLAGGSEETWPVSEVRIALQQRETLTPCFIAPAGPALLGAVALERTARQTSGS